MQVYTEQGWEPKEGGFNCSNAQPEYVVFVHTIFVNAHVHDVFYEGHIERICVIAVLVIVHKLCTLNFTPILYVLLCVGWGCFIFAEQFSDRKKSGKIDSIMKFTVVHPPPSYMYLPPIWVWSEQKANWHQYHRRRDAALLKQLPHNRSPNRLVNMVFSHRVFFAIQSIYL